MPSDLQVSNIKDLTGSNTGISIASDGQVTITQNNPTIQLGSNTTFPDGMVTNFIHRELKFDTNTSFGNTSGGGSQERIAIRGTDASAVVPSFTAKQGHTYDITFSYFAYMDMAQSVSSSGRIGKHTLYYGTTSRSANDATFDTKLFHIIHGRNMTGSTTANTSSEHGVVLKGAFYQSASDATTYVYFTTTATDNGKRVINYHSSDHPTYLSITEYKGNLSTILT